ncbi:hypothetical protein BDR22DRAFT_818057 [Usnea florida]
MEGPVKLRDRQNMDRGIHEEALSALHARGQNLYRQKQYEAALQCFTEAINQDAKTPISVLDNRAATHTKLGNLRAALNDGREIIQQDKASCVGYLRTGKILQLLGNLKMAMDLYEMGFRKVPSNDPDLVYEKLVRQVAPPRTIDPLRILPLELAEMTIKYLEFRYIVGLLRVSKSWHRLLISIPSLWNNLDLSAAKKPVTLGAVRKYIKWSNGTTTRVTFDKFGANAESIPRYVATRCKRLEDMRVPGGLIGASILKAAPCASNLKTLIVSKSCQVSCDTVSQLLCHCPNLERAEFHSVSASEKRPAAWEKDMPKLRTLVLDALTRRRGEQRPLLALDTLVAKIVGIITLSVKGWFVPPSSPGPNLDFSNLHELQHLDITRLVAQLPPQLPSTMTHLSLAGWSELSLSVLQACLLPNKGNLKHLDIGGCIALSIANLKDLITHSYLECVEDLVLKSCTLDDEIAILIARNLPRLKNLDLARTKVTGVGVKALVIGLEGKLERLDLDGCNSTSIDAVEFARAMGVKVAFGFPDRLSGGRRIKQQS